jgi:acetyl esterase/lipase
MGAAKFRALRTEGKLGLPAPVLVDNASPFSIPSRDAGRAIPCRVIKPVGAPTGVFMHIHGGGWVLGDEKR